MRSADGVEAGAAHLTVVFALTQHGFLLCLVR